MGHDCQVYRGFASDNAVFTLDFVQCPVLISSPGKVARVAKPDKDFAKTLNLKTSKNIEIPVKVRDIHKIEKRNSVGISVFGYDNVKENILIYY